jgi:hypothetical protein
MVLILIWRRGVGLKMGLRSGVVMRTEKGKEGIRVYE